MDQHPILSFFEFAYRLFHVVLFASLFIGLSISQQFNEQLVKICQLVRICE